MDGHALGRDDVVTIFSYCDENAIDCSHGNWKWTLMFDHVEYASYAVLAIWTDTKFTKYYMVDLTDKLPPTNQTPQLQAAQLALNMIYPLNYGMVYIKTAYPCSVAGEPLDQRQTPPENTGRPIALDLMRFRCWNSNDNVTSEENNFPYKYYTVLSERTWGGFADGQSQQWAAAHLPLRHDKATADKLLRYLNTVLGDLDKFVHLYSLLLPVQPRTKVQILGTLQQASHPTPGVDKNVRLLLAWDIDRKHLVVKEPAVIRSTNFGEKKMRAFMLKYHTSTDLRLPATHNGDDGTVMPLDACPARADLLDIAGDVWLCRSAPNTMDILSLKGKGMYVCMQVCVFCGWIILDYSHQTSNSPT
jgi:hypothetical protein